MFGIHFKVRKQISVVHRYMVDIFEKNNAELKFLNRQSCASGVRCPFLQSFASGARGPFLQSFASGARGPFRCAQEDYLKIVMTRTTSLALPNHFCHARRRRAAFRQKRRKDPKEKP